MEIAGTAAPGLVLPTLTKFLTEFEAGFKLSPSLMLLQGLGSSLPRPAQPLAPLCGQGAQRHRLHRAQRSSEKLSQVPRSLVTGGAPER